MRCKHKKIRQKSVVKICQNYSVQEIRETAYAHSKGHQTLLYFYFRLGKGHSSQDF